MMTSKRLLAVAVSAALYAPFAAHATNGMNLEGYGPIATGMGGASLAYDNGTAAVVNNPATIGLMADGNRVDIALGYLGPTVKTESMTSGSDAFFMPAMGWVKKDGKLAYGVGVYGQGGMGTDYKGTSPGGVLSGEVVLANDAMLAGMATSFSLNYFTADTDGVTFTANPTLAADLSAMLGGVSEFSEVSVGRLGFPLSYQVNDRLNIGGSIDYVWAGMDIQWLMAGDTMQDMMMGTQAAGTITGGLISGMSPLFFDPASPSLLSTGSFGITGLNAGYFDFKDDNDFTGKAQGNGFAGNLGFTFKANSQLTIGGVYHSKTQLSDLETKGAVVAMSVFMSSVNDVGAVGDSNAGDLITVLGEIEMAGTVKVKDFEWPQTFGLGMSYQANDKLMIAADVKYVQWSDVMKNFTLQFVADTITMNGQNVTAMFADKDMTATLKQNWSDQTVINLGASYAVSNNTVVRAGFNYAENPIPEDTVSYLFPAITEQHYTVGLGHTFTPSSSVDFSLTYAPKVTVTAHTYGDAQVSMSQTNAQLMYSYRF